MSTPIAPPRPRVVCPACGRTYVARRDGNVPVHYCEFAGVRRRHRR